MAESARNRKPKISRVETASDCLTDRAGLASFARYLSSVVALPPLIER